MKNKKFYQVSKKKIFIIILNQTLMHNSYTGDMGIATNTSLPPSTPFSSTIATNPLNGGLNNQSIQQGGKNQPTSLQNTVNTIGSDYTWKHQTQIDSLNTKTNETINWQERKILKQKMNSVYSHILNSIEDCHMVIEKFSNKISDFNKLYNDCIQEVTKTIQTFSQNIAITQLSIIIDDFFNRLNTLKSTYLYHQNKDFTEKIDDLFYNINNLRTMTSHGQVSLKEFENSIQFIISSIHDLKNITKKIENYENTAWQMYQKIDELISESDAQYNSDVINNCSINVEYLNTYLRNNFLSYINDSIIETDTSFDSIINLYRTITSEMNIVNQSIIQFEDIAQKAFEEEEKKKTDRIEQQKQEKEQKKILEEKKKKEELLKIEQSKTIFDKIEVFFKNIGNILYSFFASTTSNIINAASWKKVSSMLPKKSNSNNNNNNNNNHNSNNSNNSKDNAVVDQTINSYSAPIEKPVQFETYQIIPNQMTNQQNFPIEQISQSPITQYIDQDNTEEEVMIDVFDSAKPQDFFQKENIAGASSYPIEVTPQIRSLPPEEIQQNNQLLPFGYTPEISDQGRDNQNTEQNEEKTIKFNNDYHYTPMEIVQDQASTEDKSLLPDLSQLAMNQKALQHDAARSGELSQIRLSQNNADNTTYTVKTIQPNTLATKKKNKPPKKGKRAKDQPPRQEGNATSET